MNKKIRRTINITGAIILLAALLVTIGWFDVRGSELDFLKDLPADCVAVATVWSWDEDSENVEEKELTLSEEQWSRFLELVLSSSYWRDPASTITHNEQTNYTVFLNYDDDGVTQFLSITSCGGYAINIHGSQKMPFEQDFFADPE